MPTPSPPLGGFVLAFFEPEVKRDTPFIVRYHYIHKPGEKPKFFHFKVEAVYPGASSSTVIVPLSGVHAKIEAKGCMITASLEECKLNPARDGDLCKLKIRVSTSTKDGNLETTFETPEIKVVAKG